MQRSIQSLLKISLVILGVLALVINRPTFSQADSAAPVLLVVNDTYMANRFGSYLGEILRAEGLNAFDVIQLSSLSSSDLTSHDLTILAETSLNSGQTTLLTNYVNGGGRLLAMRPASQIKELFGLGSAAGTLNNGYLRIDNGAGLNGSTPGQGLSNVTLQIHGDADRYSPAVGAVVLGQLYSNASTATAYPAVISAGSGRAIAFTYDLARNVVYTRQGNPANGNVDTDGDGVLRTIDLFQTSGGGAPWVDRDKIPVPQADEQQRLFARLVKQMVGEARPLPQLWYFPGTAKTMLIPTGDAHANPTSYYQNEINSLSSHGGTATIYLTTGGGILDTADLATWRSQGYEFGIHPYRIPINDNTSAGLETGYFTSADGFRFFYDPIPMSRTVRNHQITWQGWTDAAEIEVGYGMALDTNFYHWGPWLEKGDGSWPHGYITGSGQPMRFIKADGTILPLYQQLTELVDEHLLREIPGGFEGLGSAAGIAVSRELIDASQAGDYAALMTQFHVDYYGFGEPQVWAEGTLDYATSKGVPIWNADEWLRFTETRHDANYGNIDWNDSTKTLSFDLSAAASGVNLSSIVPLSYRGNPLESVKVDGSTVSYSGQMIKGVNVAFVTVSAGNHSFEVKYNNSGLPGLSINDISVTEGDSGSTQAMFTVSLTGVSPQIVSVNYATANGSAVAPGDYLSQTGVLTFAPGVTSRPLTVTVQGDTLDEINETYLVNLSNPSGAILSNNQGQGTINDDDLPPTLNINDISLTEGSSGTAQAIFAVTLSAASSKIISVNYATANGSAVAPGDYASISGTVTFTPGVTSRPLTVTVQSDMLDEDDETFLVNLSAHSGATPGDSQGQGTINDDDLPPTLNINDISLTEGSSGTAQAIFAVTLSAASSKIISVNYATANGSAVAPGDYASISGTVTFTPGVTSRPLTVTVQSDTLDEDDETFLVNLSAHSGATPGDSQGQGTILDDDLESVLNINDISLTEGSSGTAQAIFTISLSEISGRMVSVNYATANGSAVAPGDYASISGTVTFTPGVTSRPLTVTVQSDMLDEDDETFLVNLSAHSGATPGDSQGQGTINDDDLPPTLNINDISLTEGSSGTAQAIFAVTLSAASSKIISVNYATANGSAVAPGDYASISGTVTFTPGVTSRPLTVTVQSDMLDEDDETFLVNLSAHSGATPGDSQGQGTINDDDLPPTLNINDISLTEGSSGTAQAIFAVTLSAASSKIISVNYATANGSAVAPGDYASISGTVTFTPGVTSRPLTVTVQSDTLDEDDETFLVNLSAHSGATPGDSQGQGTILDDDLESVLNINDISLTEGSSGTAQAIFTISLSEISGRMVSVNYATANGSAVAPGDYASISGTVTFTPGVTSRPLTVTVQSDTLDEDDETFLVNLSAHSGATPSDSQGQGTINDDDLPPTLNINDISLTEGSSGTAQAIFAVTLSAASSKIISVNYATANGSAVAPGDYASISGTVTFTPGVTSRPLTVTVQSDMLDEDDETFLVNLSAHSGATPGDSQGQGTILDDDDPLPEPPSINIFLPLILKNLASN